MKNIGMLSIACLLSACAQVTPKQDAEEVALTGAEIANKYLIVDTHIDVPFRLHRKPANVGAATASGEFDYPRAKQGGLNVPFMSIYMIVRLQNSKMIKLSTHLFKQQSNMHWLSSALPLRWIFH